MSLRDYEAEVYREERELTHDHPGYRLRQRLSTVEGPYNKAALDELLYTAEQTGLIEPLDPDDSDTVYRILQLAQALSPEELRRLRM